MKKVVSIILAMVCMLNLLSLNSFAINDEMINEEPIQLSMTNVTEEKTDDGYIVSCDLIQETSDNTRAIGWVVVGYAKFKLELLPSNGIGFVSWQINLTNGDVIKRVRATFVVEKNTLLFDPNIAKIKVDNVYTPAEYTISKGDQHSFSVDERDLPNDQKIRFKWSGVTITGAKQGYSVESDNVTGTVADF